MKKHTQLELSPVSALVSSLRNNYANAYTYANAYADAYTYANANANASDYVNANANANDYVNAYTYANAYADAYTYANANAKANAGAFSPLLRHESFMIKINLICRMKWEL